MKEIKETKEIFYESNDGIRFSNKANCEEHENYLNKTNALLAHIREYCREMFCGQDDDYCDECTNCQCPFFEDAHEYCCHFDCIPCNDFEEEL